MKIISIYASYFTDKETAHDHIADVLNLPDYYGRNLDALADVLSELPRDIGILIRTVNGCGDYSEPVIDVFCEILGDRVFII